MHSRRKFLAFSASAFCLAVAPLASAASAEEFVKTSQLELSTLLKQGAPAAKLDKVFDKVLDYHALAKASLRDHWEARSEAERAEFTSLLSRLVRSSYQRNLKKTLGYRISYLGVIKGESGEVVRTSAKSSDAREEPFSLDYVVSGAGDAQRVVDIFTEGESLVGGYRDSFNRIMKKSGFPEVLNKMRKRLEQGDDAG